MIQEAVFTTLFNLSISFGVIDPNHTVIENITILSITAPGVKVGHDLFGKTKRS